MFSLSLITRPLVWLAVSALLLATLVPTWLGASQPLARPPHSAAGATQSIVPGQTPDALDGAAWADIQAQIASHTYQAVAGSDDGYQSANVAHGWQISYRADGTTRQGGSSLDDRSACPAGLYQSLSPQRG